jgi:hypothetical protein
LTSRGMYKKRQFRSKMAKSKVDAFNDPRIRPIRETTRLTYRAIVQNFDTRECRIVDSLIKDWSSGQIVTMRPANAWERGVPTEL